MLEQLQVSDPVQMFSASQFLKSRLFGRRAAQSEATFVPRTALASRIVGTASVSDGAEGEHDEAGSDQTSFLAPPPPASFDSSDTVPYDLDDAGDWSRNFERFVPDRQQTTLTDKRGKMLKARIINVSATGVAVEADFATMPPDTVTTVGQKPVTVGREIRRGRVFLFEKPLDPARCTRQLIL